MENEGYLQTTENSFYFPNPITMKGKRIIVSKGDGRNYLGYKPDGSIHNMRKSLEGLFYEYARKEKSKWAYLGNALKKSEFILKN